MLYDITPEVYEGFPVWPGTLSLSRHIHSEIKNGERTTSSTLSATVHLGAHADAPAHYQEGGETIEERELQYYLGACQVLRFNMKKGGVIQKKDIKDPILAQRVLFATETFIYGEPVDQGFAALTPELIDYLHQKGVITIGVDTPSVDLFDSKELPCHAACAKNNIAILEGLDLTSVPEGIYELIALPLKLKGFDASPVRAILRNLNPT